MTQDGEIFHSNKKTKKKN